MRQWPALAAAALLLAQCARGLLVEVASTESRCVFDILSQDTLVSGWFALQGRDEGGKSGVEIVVMTPEDSEVFKADDITEGKFSFTAPMTGKYWTCLRNTAVVNRIVELKLKSGVEAKDLSEIAQREHLKPLAVELLRIEQVTEEIRQEMLRLFQVEADMRNVNEWTNDRVMYLTIFSLIVIFAVGGWQMVVVRDFLHKKKVI